MAGNTQSPEDPEVAKEALKKRMAGELSEHEVKQEARQLLWAVWNKCQPNLRRASGNHELHVASVAWRFADFAIDNIELARKFVSRNRAEGSGPSLAMLSELERRATWFLDLECSVCQSLMRNHSDEGMARCQQVVPPGTKLYRFRTS